MVIITVVRNRQSHVVPVVITCAEVIERYAFINSIGKFIASDRADSILAHRRITLTQLGCTVVQQIMAQLSCFIFQPAIDEQSQFASTKCNII